MSEVTNKVIEAILKTAYLKVICSTDGPSILIIENVKEVAQAAIIEIYSDAQKCALIDSPLGSGGWTYEDGYEDAANRIYEAISDRAVEAITK